MTKLTDHAYYLPCIEALYSIEVLGSGTTEPMLIRGICRETQEKSDFVVKFRNSPRMSVESSCRELIAALIATELEMNVAEPVLINISPEFVDSLKGLDGYRYASNSLGLNFGTKFFGYGFHEFIRNQRLSGKLYDQAENIFAFDIFISNADRNIEKQNMLTNGERIMIFDHELAFGFVMDIIKNPTPWILSDSDKTWIKRHYFYQALKENEHNFSSFVESFSVLGDNFWEKLSVYIPGEWHNDQVRQIRLNLTSLIEHRLIFMEELYKVLS